MLGLRKRCSPWLIALILLASTLAHAGDAEDELGNWLIWNGTVRFSDRWSLFTEAQVRLWEPASNVNEVFARVAGHYDLNDRAVVGLGYMRSRVEPFDGNALDGTTEDRLYLHFALKHSIGRAGFEHRYRYEYRFVDLLGTTEESGRLRYRLQVTTPLGKPKIEAGTWFINVYDELFLTFESTRAFDQNRLYVAGGRQFTSQANLQFGLLWQARTSEDFFRLQLFYTHNFDLRRDGPAGR